MIELQLERIKEKLRLYREDIIMFLKVFTELLKTNGLNKRQFSIKSGIPYTTIDGFYKKGYENIRLTTLRKIAAYFNVSLDYLMFGETPKDNNKETLVIQEYFSKLNAVGRAKVLDYMTDLLSNSKYADTDYKHW